MIDAILLAVDWKRFAIGSPVVLEPACFALMVLVCSLIAIATPAEPHARSAGPLLAAHLILFLTKYVRFMTKTSIWRHHGPSLR